MPENEKDSGVKPGSMQPTVIGEKTRPQPTVFQPTVMKTDHPSQPQAASPTRVYTPTVMRTSVPVEPPNPVPPTVYKPTAMQGSAPQAINPPKAVEPVRTAEPTKVQFSSVPKAPPPQQTMVVQQPSLMKGMVRQGIEVTEQELRKRFPVCPPITLGKIQSQLKHIFVDTLTDAECAQWGSETQKRYGELTEKSLALTGTPVIQDSERHLMRLIVLLAELGEYFEGKHSTGFGPWKKTESPWEHFQKVLPELNQLGRLLTDTIPKLLVTQTEIMTLESKFDALMEELEVESLIGEYIADIYLPKDRHGAIQALVSRSGSLFSTVALIKQGNAMRMMAKINLEALILRIQEGVQNSLPAWKESVTFTYQRSSQSETDLYSLRQGLAAVQSLITKRS